MPSNWRRNALRSRSDLCLPAFVIAPVLLAALRLFASIRLSEVMTCRFWFVIYVDPFRLRQGVGFKPQGAGGRRLGGTDDFLVARCAVFVGLPVATLGA